MKEESKKNTFQKMVYLFAIIFGATSLYARTVQYDEARSTVRVNLGKQSLFKFDVPVSTISSIAQFDIKPASEESPDFALISVEPRVPGAVSNAVFILADKTVVKVKLTAVIDDKLENFIEFKSKKNSDEQLPENPDYKKASKVDLIKALILEDKLAGYKIRNLDKPVKSDSKFMHITLHKVYEGKELSGYVYQFKNISLDIEQSIDIRDLKIGKPNAALMSYIEKKKLLPGEDTRLVLVAKASAKLTNVILPLGQIQKQKE